MKSKKSKKRIALNFAAVLVLLFLSLSATERIIRTPLIISALSKWSLLILPFLQRSGTNACNCIKPTNQ